MIERLRIFNLFFFDWQLICRLYGNVKYHQEQIHPYETKNWMTRSASQSRFPGNAPETKPT